MTICPIGPVEGDILDRIVICIEKQCGLVCNIAPILASPKTAYDKRRNQYNSKTILKNLLTYPHDSIKLIGITHLDIYVPILKYVFGLAQMEGPCAVISLHRLRPQFYDQPANPSLFMARIEKTVLHELGHSLGLTHCRDRRCLMSSATRISDTDHKKSQFCPSCSELFKWYLGGSLP